MVMDQAILIISGLIGFYIVGKQVRRIIKGKGGCGYCSNKSCAMWSNEAPGSCNNEKRGIFSP